MANKFGQSAERLISKQFGELVVNSICISLEGKTRRALCVCKCSCGNTAIVRPESLRKDKTKSCGCLTAELKRKTRAKTQDPIDSVKHALYCHYICGARKRHIKFDIEEDELTKLFSEPCHYCGHPPRKEFKGFKYNGADRKDNDRGYTKDNIVPCCYICNRAKNNLSYNTFIEYLKGVMTYR